MIYRHKIEKCLMLPLIFIALFGCAKNNTLWEYDEEAPEAILNRKFTGEIDEMRIFGPTEVKNRNDFYHVENPDLEVAKKCNYKSFDKKNIDHVISLILDDDHNFDSNKDSRNLSDADSLGDHFFTILFVESSKKKLIRFRVAMPKNSIEKFGVVFPLWETNSIFGAIRLPQWLQEVTANSGQCDGVRATGSVPNNRH